MTATPMIKTLSLSFVAVAFLAMGCNEDAPTITSTPAPFDPSLVMDPAPASTAPASGDAVVTDPNPAHGEPGHRCEIPVGASLSSTPSPAPLDATGGSSPMFNNAPPPAPVTPSLTTSGTGARVNPAHGEPGHDCNVAVGAPLPG